MKKVMSRKDFLKTLGLGFAAISTGVLLNPIPTYAGVSDNLTPVQQTYIGPNQPATTSEYLLWQNTVDGCLYYREDTATTTWKNTASVWS